MREKRRKIPLEVILDTPVSEARRKHGQQVYASRLCVKGDRLAKAGNPDGSTRVFEEAKAYCMKNGLDFPPFSGVPAAPAVLVVASDPHIENVAQHLSDGAREAGPVVREEATPQEVANIGDNAPPDPFAGSPNGGVGEPLTGGSTISPPHETRTPALRKAKVWARCPNKRLLKIKFMDGKEEYGSMWNYRSGYRINDILEVELDKGSGASCIWQERRKPV